jgi:hypothetical protein
MLPKFDKVQPWMGGLLIVLALTGVLGYLLSPIFVVVQTGLVLIARLFLGA